MHVSRHDRPRFHPSFEPRSSWRERVNPTFPVHRQRQLIFRDPKAILISSAKSTQKTAALRCLQSRYQGFYDAVGVALQQGDRRLKQYLNEQVASFAPHPGELVLHAKPQPGTALVAPNLHRLRHGWAVEARHEIVDQHWSGTVWSTPATVKLGAAVWPTKLMHVIRRNAGKICGRRMHRSWPCRALFSLDWGAPCTW